MEILTQHLPSGYTDYPFISVNIKPMTFAQILEYMDCVPESPVEKFYFDYKQLIVDDPNIDNLLFCDLEFLVFLKKSLTISKNIEFSTSANCPNCKSGLRTQVSLGKIKFNKLDPKLLKGLKIDLDGRYHNVRMPTVKQFLEVFINYKRAKKVTDMNIIKLIALFEGFKHFPQFYEELVTNATYQDVSAFTMLNIYYYRTVEPLTIICPECKRRFERLKDLKMEELIKRTEPDAKLLIRELQEKKYEGVALEIPDLIANFFRDVTENNQLTEAQIVPREVRKDEEHRDVHIAVH